MSKIFSWVLAGAVCLGTTAVLAKSGGAARQGESADAQMATDGAFRDGLFVGRLASESGRAERPLIGRWSRAEDRASFVAGYRRGYEGGPSFTGVVAVRR